jgi:hypothetical protein
MTRPKGTKNKNQSGISYPRKCNHCEYISNNPQMWHYHKQIHDPIPDDKMCDHGCGQHAMFRGTGGKYTCVKNSFTCPKYLEIHAKRVKEQWDNDDQRKKDLSIKNPMKDDSTKIKQAKLQSESKRKKSGLLFPGDAKNYRHYARAIRERAQMWAKEQGYEIGRQTYHVDHKLSILDAWNANLPAEITNHPANLRILEAKKNSSKGSKSSITLDELLESIKAAASSP